MQTPNQLKLFTLIVTLFISSQVFAHGEQLQISEQLKDSVQLSDQQRQLIDLKTYKVQQKPMKQLLGLNGELKLVPDAQADVSVRISGNVRAIYANLGDKVKLSQPLVKIQSLLIGDPPPSIVVNAPMAGVIDARNITLGQAVVPNTVLFHISDRSKLLVLAKVYEEDLEQVKEGQQAIIHVLSFPNLSFMGKVNLIEPNLDPLTRTVNVQIIVDNPKDLLKPGMFTRTNLVLQENKSTLVVPSAAIIEANNQKFVFKKEANSYKKMVVQTGMSNDDYVQIVSGLVAGDEVVTQGNRQLYTYWLTGGTPPATKGS